MTYKFGQSLIDETFLRLQKVIRGMNCHTYNPLTFERFLETYFLVIKALGCFLYCFLTEHSNCDLPGYDCTAHCWVGSPYYFYDLQRQWLFTGWSWWHPCELKILFSSLPLITSIATIFTTISLMCYLDFKFRTVLQCCEWQKLCCIDSKPLTDFLPLGHAGMWKYKKYMSTVDRIFTPIPIKKKIFLFFFLLSSLFSSFVYYHLL